MLQNKSRLKLAMGIPDSGFAAARIGPNGRPTIEFSDQVQLPAAFLEQNATRIQRIWFPSTPVVPPNPHEAIINLCVDPWGSKRASGSMQIWLGKGALVFNHPRAVARINQTQFLRQLSAIPGLTMPQRASFSPKTPADFRQVTMKLGLRFPIVLQEASDRTTSGGMVIKSQKGWGKAQELDWPTRTYFVTEVSPERLAPHKRLRVTFIGQQAEVVSFQFSHASRITPRGALDLPPQFNAICGALHSVIGLDHWTVEFSQDALGQLQLEHLWAGLPAAEPGSIQPNAQLWANMSGKLGALLAQPDRWRSAQAVRPQQGKHA